MGLALVEDKPAFDLAIDGWDRTLNGNRTDEKTFMYAGLEFETEVEFQSAAHPAQVTLRILQDKVELLTHRCDSISIRSVSDSEISIRWSRGAMGKNHGSFTIVPGWKVGSTLEHVPDVNF